MSKKKIVTLALSAIIAVTAIAGASLAYLTDTDSATNTFAVGNVKIKLNEQQRKYDNNGNVTGLEDFVNNKNLQPIVESAQSDAKDKYGLPTSGNYVDKIVTVTNTGKNSAYVRVLVAIPADLEGSDASKNFLHWNTGNKFTAAGNYDTTATPQPENADYATKCVYKNENTTVTLDGIVYNIYSFTYADALASGATTEYASFVGFYLDKNLDCDYDANGKLFYTVNGTKVTYDLTKGIKVPVYAQAVQADGFNSASQAFSASGLPVNPWA